MLIRSLVHNVHHVRATRKWLPFGTTAKLTRELSVFATGVVAFGFAMQLRAVGMLVAYAHPSWYLKTCAENYELGGQEFSQ